MKKNCSFFKAAPYCLALKIFPFFLLSVFLFSNITVQAQVNAYARVTSISGLRLNLSNVNQDSDTFQNGDQIIVMQMQDDVIGGNTGNNANFGNLSAIASAGYYEVATINSASNLPSYITITATLQHTFNTGSNSRVQIISYRKMSTSDYTTLANITALSWNGNIGGVVAMQVPGIFTLAHDITVDAQGFRGGAASADVDDDCMPDSYRSNSTNFGAKGEGIFCRTATSQTRGRAHILTGGGGGSTNNAGGGGGGNYSAGGQGGAGWTCSASPSGGIGGIGLAGSITYERIFMGGGGGGGQQNNTVGTAGSNGGGIVLIRAQTLTTNCSGTRMISANGGNAVNSGNDGAGGAGAGGPGRPGRDRAARGLPPGPDGGECASMAQRSKHLYPLSFGIAMRKSRAALLARHAGPGSVRDGCRRLPKRDANWRCGFLAGGVASSPAIRMRIRNVLLECLQ